MAVVAAAVTTSRSFRRVPALPQEARPRSARQHDFSRNACLLRLRKRFERSHGARGNGEDAPTRTLVEALVLRARDQGARVDPSVMGWFDTATKPNLHCPACLVEELCLRQEVEWLRRQLESAEADKAAALASAEAEARAARAAWEVERAALEGRAAALGQEIGRLRAEIEQLRALCAGAQEEVRRLTQELQEARERSSTDQSRIAALEAALQGMEQEVGGLFFPEPFTFCGS